MLPEENRLRHAKDFLRVYRQGRAKANNVLVLYRLPNGLDTYRFGFSISKKIGKAHCRNRYKRRLSEMVRLHRSTFKPGYDMILVARKPIVDCDYDALERHFLTLAERSGVCDHDDSSTPGLT